MNAFLVLQNTYDELQIALMKDNQLIASRSLSKINASALFTSELQTLLDTHQVKLLEIPFIAVNQGPGPFTTLQVLLASANGLSFATNIPLIGVDGLDACLQEYADSNFPNTVILLNAFSKDVYFAIQTDGKITKGYHNIDALIERIKQLIPHEQIRFLGNGTQMFAEKITAAFAQNAYIPEKIPSYCSITTVGALALEAYKKNKQGKNQLLPLYLKKHALDTQ
jgi:tRNA threonylcarbamoyladenosine biosynthesis protein TsaB